MSSTWAQVRALVGLRWRMVRSRRVRRGLMTLAMGVVLLAVFGVLGAQALPARVAFNAALLTPTAFLVFAVLAVVAPLTAGGGYDLFPAEQITPHPVRPATTYLITLLMAPLNVAWIVQVLALCSLTAYIVRTPVGLTAALPMTLVYVVVATVVGQTVAWLVVGARRRRLGRLIVWALAAGAISVSLIAAHGQGQRLLDRSPTRPVVIALLAGANEHYTQWALMLAALTLLGAVASRVGIAATAWALRAAGEAGTRRTADAVPRRRPRRGVSAELRAVDRASVWRAPALRRGALVISILPGVVGAAARLDWHGIAVTTGLVAAGAGLLFGVNVFCLDASGATWLASQPHDPRKALTAKARVLLETCLVTTAIAAVVSGARAPEHPTAAEFAAVVASALCCTMLVVATCLRLSVDRPHRADLRGPRDTPAPPGTMAVYSMRLAAITTLTALLVAAMGGVGVWWLPLATAAAVSLLAIRSLIGTLRRFDDVHIRTRVLSTVASG